MRFYPLIILFSLFSGTLMAQGSLKDFYEKSQQKGHLDLKPEVNILRIGLSGIGVTYADSLEKIYHEAVVNVSQITKDGFLSNGVGRYFTKKELIKKIDVFEVKDYFEHRESKYYDFSDFFKNMDKHMAEAELRMQESLFFEINEDCREPDGFEKFGNLECWAEKIDNYLTKKIVLDGMKDDIIAKPFASSN